MLAEVEDLLFGFAQATGEALEFGDAAFQRHGDPASEPLVGALVVGVDPDLAEGVFEQVGHGKVAVGAKQGVELAAPVGAQVLGVELRSC